jgi:hypothetical protein
LGDAVTAVSKKRHTEPGALRRQLTGDLDWIVLKALDKNRSGRYASVSEFGADARRFLFDEVVIAGPPSATRVLRKFIRRHRAAVAAGSFLGVCALGALIAIIFGLNERTFVAEDQRAQKLGQLFSERGNRWDHFDTDFLISVFEQSKSTALGPQTPAIRLVDDRLNALRREQLEIGHGASYKVEYIAWRLDALAQIYEGLNVYDRAEPLYLEALDLRARLPWLFGSGLVDSYSHLAVHYDVTERPKQAAAMREKEAATRRKTAGIHRIPWTVRIAWTDPRLDGVKRELGTLDDVLTRDEVDPN